MTISSSTRKAGPYVGTGVASSFPFSFKVFAASDLLIVKLNQSTSVETTLALTTDYTVSLNADQNASPGGTITLVAGALASGYTLTITSSISALQQTDLTNQGGFYPSVITNALDKLTILVQQLIEKLGRSLTLPLSMPANVSTSLPLPSSNKVIGWNSTADALVNLNAADLATTIIGATNVIDTFSGTGSQTAFTLSADPLNINNLDIYISGVRQAKSKYSLSGVTLTFVTAPPAGTSNIEVKQAQAQTYPVSSLTDNVVTTSKINDSAVTTAKIADANVTTAKIADANVTPAKLSGAFGSWVTAATAALARTALGLGTAATVDTGTSAGNAVILDGSAKLPAVDGSQLTGITTLPSQTGNSGKFLTTNGTAASWGIVQNPEVLGYVSGRYYAPICSIISSNTLTCDSTKYNGKILMQPFWVHATQTFSAISCYVSTLVAAKNIRLGIYSDNNGTPGTLVLDAGTASFATTGQKDVAISQSLSAGTYWLALITDATATGVLGGMYVGGIEPGNTPMAGPLGISSLAGLSSSAYGWLSGTQAYGALPSTPPAMTAQTFTGSSLVVGPAIILKAA